MSLSPNERAAQIMEHLVSCNRHGYSQYSRNGDGGSEMITLSDGSNVTINTGDRDCSSAVIDAYRSAGVDVGGATYTGNMRSCMCGTGNFEWMPMSYTAQRGDIYLNEVNHTAMCTSAVPDMLAEFSISENGTIDGIEGDQTGYESHIRAYYNYPWNGILRYVGGGSSSAPTYSPSHPKPENLGIIPVHYALRVLNGDWWSEVTNFNNSDSEGYAGSPNTKHDLLYAYVDKGSLRYRTHVLGGGWLPWVYKADKNDLINGVAGNPGQVIDGVQFYYTTPDGIAYHQAYYRSQTTQRSGWLPVCSDDGTNGDGYDGWAGMYGEPLDRLQLCIATSNPF